MRNLRNILAGAALIGLAGCAERPRPISKGVIKSESYTPKTCFNCSETYRAIVELSSGEKVNVTYEGRTSVMDPGMIDLRYNVGDTVNVQQNYGNPRVYQIVDPSVREQR